MRNTRRLSSATTLRVGGVPLIWEQVATEKELRLFLADAKAGMMSCRVLGGGSNVLARDGDLDCAVMQITHSAITVDSEDESTVLVRVGAGAIWDELVAFTVREGWWGLENLSAIPGTVGAAPIQNIGAYGADCSVVCVAVRAFDTSLSSMVSLTPTDMSFEYRDSIFKQEPERYIVWEVAFRLSKLPRPRLRYTDFSQYFEEGAVPAIGAVRDAVVAIRARKFPDMRTVGTAGSFFKNPIVSRNAYNTLVSDFPGLPQFPGSSQGEVKIPIAYILEKLGYKGYVAGAVGMHREHALVLVAHEGSTASDIDTFASHIESRVLSATDITLEREVQFFP